MAPRTTVGTRLAAIHSFAIWEKTARLWPRSVGKVSQIVCALPDAWWEFLDYRPGLMGFSVTAANARTGLGWSSYQKLNGVRVPRRLMQGRDATDAHVEINPDYEPLIFTTPPSPDATMEAWRKK